MRRIKAAKGTRLGWQKAHGVVSVSQTWMPFLTTLNDRKDITNSDHSRMNFENCAKRMRLQLMNDPFGNDFEWSALQGLCVILFTVSHPDGLG